jgi:ubiquinone/menaquinone biosynthesis C-methylase UbiE
VQYGIDKTEAQSYNSFASEVFAPIYPYYANEIVARTGIRSGCCLDVGCGGGHLGLAILQIADFNLYLLDNSQVMIRLAEENAEQSKTPNVSGIVLAEVQSIPLRDDCMDLAVSRGSVPFWNDLPASFREIQRILRPGGHACIFGGLGPPQMREAIERQMRLKNPDWHAHKKRDIPRREKGQYTQSLQIAGIRHFSVARNDNGMWIEFSK